MLQGFSLLKNAGISVFNFQSINTAEISIISKQSNLASGNNNQKEAVTLPCHTFQFYIFCLYTSIVSVFIMQGARYKTMPITYHKRLANPNPKKQAASTQNILFYQQAVIYGSDFDPNFVKALHLFIKFFK